MKDQEVFRNQQNLRGIHCAISWMRGVLARDNGSAVLPALVQLQNTPTVKNSVNCAENQPCSSSQA